MEYFKYHWCNHNIGPIFTTQTFMYHQKQNKEDFNKKNVKSDLVLDGFFGKVEITS